jgi:membrane protein insertase Oxa1/YidC/SpoIIIJ
MKEELTELQKIWKDYPRKNERSMELLREIKKIDQKEKVNNMVKTGVFLITVSFLIFIFFTFHFISLMANIGFAVICISMVIHSSIMWWIQTIHYEEKIKQPSKHVFEPALRKLTLKKYFIKYFIPLLAFELAIGINLIYLEIFENQGLPFRLLIHGSVTVLLLLIFYLGWQKYSKKITKNTDLLIFKMKDEQKKLILEL